MPRGVAGVVGGGGRGGRPPEARALSERAGIETLGRDELITELVRDAYRSLADTFRAASSRPGADVAVPAHALRTWALEDPQRRFLIYGTPVPGHHAPDDITAIASEIMAALRDAWAGGHPAPTAALHRALTFWTRPHGTLSLELAGHFDGMGFDPERFYAAELDELTGDGPM